MHLQGMHASGGVIALVCVRLWSLPCVGLSFWCSFVSCLGGLPHLNFLLIWCRRVFALQWVISMASAYSRFPGDA